jgi:hypothetical protein
LSKTDGSRIAVSVFEGSGALLQVLLLRPTTVSYRAAENLTDLMYEKQVEALPPLKWQRGPVSRDRWLPPFSPVASSEVSA